MPEWSGMRSESKFWSADNGLFCLKYEKEIILEKKKSLEKNRNVSLDQLTYLIASIKQILHTDEMAPGEKKAKYKLRGWYDYCGIKRISSWL